MSRSRFLLLAFILVLAAAQEVLGPEDTRTARTHHNLGEALRRQGDLTGARHHFDAALAIFRKKLGDEHPDTLRVLQHLSWLDRAPADELDRTEPDDGIVRT